GREHGVGGGQTYPAGPGRGFETAGRCEDRADVRQPEIDERLAVALDPAGGGAPVETDGCEFHAWLSSVCARYRLSLAKIGASLNWNRSSAPESESDGDACDRIDN